ncbi:hypothetical protein [Marinobacterium rhizophilum]|uniref:hypothetical protein n=1 Tax=Marinobacterium rhizophilum TaxID=420402 RepID=UPI000382D351|nr:hypothetical protein [Marinobacterium rhizophilum]
MNVKQISWMLLASLLLGGCVANATAPGGAPSSVAATPGAGDTATGQQAGESAPEESAPASAAPVRSGQSSAENSAAGASATPGDEALQRNLDTLANRLTLVQEQLIQIKAQGAELSEQSNTALARLQMLSSDASQAGAEDGGASDAPSVSAAPEQLAGLIDQLSQIANELSLSGVGDRYRIAADYTGAGQWILIRYDRFNGESWLADQGAWQPLLETVPLERSEYEVQLTRADNDIKGYVAARLDRRNGDSWWLKQDTWQKFE